MGRGLYLQPGMQTYMLTLRHKSVDSAKGEQMVNHRSERPKPRTVEDLVSLAACSLMCLRSSRKALPVEASAE